MSYEDLGNFIETHLPFFSVIAVVIGLFFTASSWSRDRKSRELQIAESRFKELQSLSREYYDKYNDMNEDKKKNWDDLFFNSLEWFAFLINEKRIEKKIIAFFDDAIISYYEDIFVKVMPQNVIVDENQYEELKKLYKKLKKQKENKPGKSERRVGLNRP